MCDNRFGRLRDLLLARLSIVLNESVKMVYRRCVVVCCSCRTFSNAALMAAISPVWTDTSSVNLASMSTSEDDANDRM